MKFIHVRWLDASYQGHSLKPEDFSRECIIDTAGFLASETPDYVSVALEYSEEDKEFKHTTHIPRKYIIKKRKIK